jgi:hypothetical protein
MGVSGGVEDKGEASSVLVAVEVFVTKLSINQAGLIADVVLGTPASMIQSWLTHFGLVIKYEDGSSWVLEREQQGIQCYPPHPVNSQNPSKCGTEPWVCLFWERADGSEKVTRQHVLDFARAQTNTGYDLLNCNCKHFTWDFLEQLFPGTVVKYCKWNALAADLESKYKYHRMKLVDNTNGAKYGCCSEDEAEYYIMTEEGPNNVMRYCFPTQQSANSQMANWTRVARVLYDKCYNELCEQGLNPIAIGKIKCAQREICGTFTSQLVDRTNGEEHGCCSKEDAEYYIVTEEGQGTIKRYCFPGRESADAKTASWWMCSRVLFDRSNTELRLGGLNGQAIARIRRVV